VSAASGDRAEPAARETAGYGSLRRRQPRDAAEAVRRLGPAGPLRLALEDAETRGGAAVAIGARQSDQR
jgi:hypothetical protein